MNYKEELYRMREAYRAAPLEDIDLRPPLWLDDDDPMREMYEKKAWLLKHGVVTYACIVQANERLFRRWPPFNYPAHIVFSTDLRSTDTPDELYDVAWNLFSYKGADPSEIPPEWREVAAVITDEFDRSDFTFSVNGKTYRMIPTMVHRKLLPKGKLCGQLLPILTAPKCTQVMVLPKRYWSKEFTRLWTKG